jgi:hypothetical protein
MKCTALPPILFLWFALATVDPAFAFTVSTPTCPSAGVCIGAHGSVASSPAPTFNQRSRRRRIFENDPSRKSSITLLKMAAEDFNESKYTEAAWSSIAALSKVADFYQSPNVDAPYLLDVMLNPEKHNAGENAEAAKRVVEKILNKAGVNVKDLRSELEAYLSRQPRTSNNSQKALGRTIQTVLETARIGQNVLGVSCPRACAH